MKAAATRRKLNSTPQTSPVNYLSWCRPYQKGSENTDIPRSSGRWLHRDTRWPAVSIQLHRHRLNKGMTYDRI
jgi:hypothetical protein